MGKNWTPDWYRMSFLKYKLFHYQNLETQTAENFFCVIFCKDTQLSFSSGTQEEVYQKITNVLVEDGIEKRLAYDAVVQIYKEPDQSDPRCTEFSCPCLVFQHFSSRIITHIL